MFRGNTWLNTPAHSCKISAPNLPPPSSLKLNCRHSPMSRSVRIAIVGDVHDDWSLEEDRKALQFLKPDLVLFTGDFGNENVELVKNVADLDMVKAVILGNHDVWRTHSFSVKGKDNVQLQLECLGDEHVGYRRLDFPMLKLSVVGGRPFSCGGAGLYRKLLLKARYDVSDMNGSAAKIYQAALGCPEDHSVIFLAHNGPTGLGSQMNDICGKDWQYGAGDHGDPDLANALSQLKETTKFNIPLVVFGHMHKGLRYGGLRKMIVIGNDGTTYLNGAIVPRVQKCGTQESLSTLRGFTIAEFSNGSIQKIAETWVSVTGDNITLAEEQILYNRI